MWCLIKLMKKLDYYQSLIIIVVTLLSLCGVARADLGCHVQTAGGIVAVPMTSEDADHLYFFGRSGSDNFNATYHKSEKFMYLEMTLGRSNPVKVSGNYIMTGTLPASLVFTQGRKLLDFICQ